MVTVIGISGKKRSGKDEFVKIASRLCEARGILTCRIAFADALKEEVAKFLVSFASQEYDALRVLITPVSTAKVAAEIVAPLAAIPPRRPFSDLMRAFNDDVEKAAYRKLLQWWGTEFRRSFRVLGDEDDRDSAYSYLRRQFPHLCLDGSDDYWLRQWDARAKSPAAVGKLIFVPDLRFPNEFDFLRGKEGAYLVRITRPGLDYDAHPSETALDYQEGWDSRIVNGSTLADYETYVSEVMEDALTRGSWRMH